MTWLKLPGEAQRMAKLPKNIIRKYGISKKAWSIFRGEKRTTTRRVSGMARRRHSRSRGGGGPGGGKLMNGLIKPSGMLGQAVSGLGAAYVSNLIPVNIPYKPTIAAFLVGGIPGAVATVLVGNMSGAASNQSGIKLW